jgi:hypothetical protein
MAESLVEEIRTKSAALPVEKQREVLDFVEFILHKSKAAPKRPFRSVQGILQGEFPDLEQDITEMRREAWGNFPRELPVEKNR